MPDTEQDFLEWQNDIFRQQSDEMVRLIRTLRWLTVEAYKASRTTKGYPAAYMDGLHEVLASSAIMKILRAEGLEDA